MPTQSPDSSTTGAIEDKALDKESLIEFLGEDDVKEPETLELEEPDKKDKKDPKTAEGKEKEEVKEPSLEEELELELKEPDEEDELDLVAPPARKEILTKYPQIFKDFPYLEKALYRDQKYAELLPTIKDAQEAVEKASLLDKYEKEIQGGSTESLLATIRDNDKESFAKVVDNYLPTLFNVDQSAYYHTIGNIIKHTIISMVKSSKEKEDDELGTAAAVLNNFIFGSNTFTHPTKLSKDDSNVDDGTKKRETEISQREKQFLENQFTTARDTLGTKVDNIIRATVDKVIDPNDSMPDYVKKNAIREVLESLEGEFKKDTRFQSIFDKLWGRAFDTSFSAESLDKIQKAYLSKAKTLLPFLIRKTRTEALKGLRRSTDNDDKDKRGHLPVGKTRSSTTRLSGNANQGSTSKTQIPKGMSTLDFLNSED